MWISDAVDTEDMQSQNAGPIKGEFAVEAQVEGDNVINLKVYASEETVSREFDVTFHVINICGVSSTLRAINVKKGASQNFHAHATV